jgi:hypothetical protein
LLKLGLSRKSKDKLGRVKAWEFASKEWHVYVHAIRSNSSIR